MELVFDVHAGAVVGQLHDFVGVQFVGELVRQRRARLDFAHELHEEVARADELIEDVGAF